MVVIEDLDLDEQLIAAEDLNEQLDESARQQGDNDQPNFGFSLIREHLAWVPRALLHRRTLAAVEEISVRPFRNGRPHAYAGEFFGHVISSAWMGLATFWLLVMVLPILTMQQSLSKCTQHGIAEMPEWVSFLYPAIFCVSMFLEKQAFSRAIVPLATAKAPFTILGIRQTFGVWLCAVIFLSVLSHLDGASNAIFVAIAYKTESCTTQGDRTFHDVFKEVVDASLFGKFPLVSNIQFSSWANVSWVVMFLQPLYALLASYPSNPNQNNLLAPAHAVRYDMMASEYDTIMNTQINHHDALIVVADMARMASLSFQDLDALWPDGYLAKMQHVKRKLFVFSLLETSVHANLQVTFLGVSRAVTKDQHRQLGLTEATIALTFLSAIVSFALAAKKIHALHVSLQEQMKSYEEEFKRSRHECLSADASADDAFRRWMEKSKNCQYDALKLRPWAREIIRDFWAISIFYWAFMIYAASKLVATFYCKDAVWNLGGCVSLSG